MRIGLRHPYRRPSFECLSLIVTPIFSEVGEVKRVRIIREREMGSVISIRISKRYLILAASGGRPETSELIC